MNPELQQRIAAMFDQLLTEASLPVPRPRILIVEPTWRHATPSTQTPRRAHRTLENNHMEDSYAPPDPYKPHLAQLRSAMSASVDQERAMGLELRRRDRGFMQGSVEADLEKGTGTYETFTNGKQVTKTGVTPSS